MSSIHMRLILFLKPYARQLIVTWLVVGFAAAFTMAQPQVLRWGIDAGLKPPQYTATDIKLSENITAAQTSFKVNNPSELTPGESIRIESETVRVTAISDGSVTVDRGQDGTRARVHDSGKALKRVKRAGFEGKTETLLLAGGILLGLAAFRAFFTYWQTFLGEWLAQHVAFDLRNKIYDRLQRLSYAYHDQQQTGQVMSRATQDVEATRMFIQMGMVRLVDITVRVSVAVVSMLFLDWRLTIVAWVILPIMAYRSIKVQAISRRMWTGVQEQLGRVTTVLQENLTGVRVVKAFSREHYEEEKFNKEAQELFEWNVKQNKVQASNMPFYQAMGMLAQAVVLAYGSFLITRGSLTPGELAAFLVYQTLLAMPMRMIGMIVQQFARAGAAGERIFEILDAESAVKEKPDAVNLTAINGEIRFDHVSFAYDSISSVLRDVDFVAPAGKLVALLGPTGSGKSTVVNLLPRFYDVTSGGISIDGVDIRDVTLSSLRANIGIIQQDVFLFSATIRDNIAYGAVDATYEQIIEAAKIARIHDYIMSLPDGYDTWVGERGITLSGGQKQRISIARTLLLNPRILILDDSTSSVDTQTEFLIQQALADVMKGRTTLVIAQRLRTVKNADQILVMKDGVIAERGTHDQLIAEDGIYREIYDLELRDQEEALQRATSEPGR